MPRLQFDPFQGPQMPFDLDREFSSKLATIATLPASDITPIQNQLRAFESDFDRAQSSLRTIASAWILAAVGAVSLVTQNEFSGASRLDPIVASSFRQALLLIATLGLTSLWYLDQRVYQRLLHSVFSTGCHLELATDKILPIRVRAYKLNSDVTNHLGWFYRAPLIVLLLGSVGSFYQSLFGFNATISALLGCSFPGAKPFQIWALPLIITAVHVAFFTWVTCKSQKWPTLHIQLPRQLVEDDRPAGIATAPPA
jgi:hypothetical protein